MRVADNDHNPTTNSIQTRREPQDSPRTRQRTPTNPRKPEESRDGLTGVRTIPSFKRADNDERPFYETRSNESFSSDDTSTAQNDSLEAAREAVRTATNRQPEKSPKRQLGSTYESSQMTSGAAREAGRMTKKAATKVNRMTA